MTTQVPLNVRYLMINNEVGDILSTMQWNTPHPVPDPEYHSLKETYKFLCDLTDPQKTPKIAKSIRDKANKCLKDYPVRRTLEELQVTVDFFNPR